MNTRFQTTLFFALLFALFFALLFSSMFAASESSAQASEFPREEVAKATVAAIDFASPSVVQIDSIGGLTPKGQSRSTAPFTGTVVSKDGLILTASYNLLHQPASIFVKALNEGNKVERFAAKIVATDNSRNLTLLKIDRDDLVPIQFADLTKILPGQKSIAIGNSISIGEPNVSFGIVSATGRIWNRATQTDAKISRLNYGGPLINLKGEAIGILAPMQHSSSEIAAGSQWYDSGIGFAASIDPNSDAFKNLLAGESLRSGLIGVSFEGPDENADPAKISFCLPTSPAGKAGLKVGDTIIEAAGQKIVRQGQFKHIIGPRYENETLAVKVDRDGKLIDLKVTLAGEIDPYIEPELGILIQFDAPIVSAIIPSSPAAKSDLKPDDKIVKVNDAETLTTDEVRLAISQLVVGEPCRIIVERKEESIELSMTPRRQLANLLEKTPSRYQEASQQRAFETLEINVAEGANKCVAIVPKDNAEGAEEAEGAEDKLRPKSAVLVWVPPPGQWATTAMFKKFESFCSSADAIVLIPQSVDPEKWLPDDTSVIAKAIERLQQRFSIDKHRVAIAGEGVGGEMALLTAFSNRKTFKGVAIIDADLPTDIPNVQSLPSNRLHMLVLGGDDNEEGISFFRDKGFSIFEDPQSTDAFKQISGWLETLDRL